MTTTEEIQVKLKDAVSIGWDGCHKIYINMDEQQHQNMVEYGYEKTDPSLGDAAGRSRSDDGDLIRVENQLDSLIQLREWWDSSCSLRFISAVRTVDGNPNLGFEDMIPQSDETGWPE